MRTLLTRGGREGAMSCEVWRNRIDAYVDGETSGAGIGGRSKSICGPATDCAAEALGRMQMKRATRAAAAMRFTPSPELRRAFEKASRRSGGGWLSCSVPPWPWRLPLVLVLAIGFLCHVVRRARAAQDMAQLLDMHVAALASANPVDVVSSDRHTVKPWFQGKLPFTFNLPELAGSQYKLRRRTAGVLPRPARRAVDLRTAQARVLGVHRAGDRGGGRRSRRRGRTASAPNHGGRRAFATW